MSKLQRRLGRWVKVFPGRNGVVQSAEIVTLDPSNRVTRLTHSLEKLYEVRSEAELEEEKSNEVLD